tara:strand:+ start:182 stop:427 length:246 start_codon:yes stop_codon:yes gene_type:complete
MGTILTDTDAVLEEPDTVSEIPESATVASVSPDTVPTSAEAPVSATDPESNEVISVDIDPPVEATELMSKRVCVCAVAEVN